MGALFDNCPGAADIRGTPSLKEKACPACGAVIELFSNEMQTQCKCGFIAYNEAQNCVSWCKYARECVGAEAYERITSREPQTGGSADEKV